MPAGADAWGEFPELLPTVTGLQIYRVWGPATSEWRSLRGTRLIAGGPRVGDRVQQPADGRQISYDDAAVGARDPIFGPPAVVPAGAAPGDRLAAFLGRRSLGRRRPLPALEQGEQAGEALVSVAVGDAAVHQVPDLAHPRGVHAE
jgi:hypothetical protein